MDDDPDQPRQLRACQAELSSPDTDWVSVWARVRLPSLASQATSFAWQLVHGLLPTEGRVGEVLQHSTSTCRHACPGDPVADLQHVFFSCRMTEEVGTWLLTTVKGYNPTATPDTILRLEVGSEDCLAWMVVMTLFYCWKKRTANKLSKLQDCLATLTAEATGLTVTRFSNLGFLCLDMMKNI